jgi:hypothetical protein
VRISSSPRNYAASRRLPNTGRPIQLKIRVSAVQFCPWPPCKSVTYDDRQQPNYGAVPIWCPNRDHAGAVAVLRRWSIPIDSLRSRREASSVLTSSRRHFADRRVHRRRCEFSAWASSIPAFGSSSPELLGIHINLPSAVPAEILKALQSGSGKPPGLSADESNAFDRLAFFFTDDLSCAQQMANHPAVESMQTSRIVEWSSSPLGRSRTRNLRTLFEDSNIAMTREPRTLRGSVG